MKKLLIYFTMLVVLSIMAVASIEIYVILNHGKLPDFLIGLVPGGSETPVHDSSTVTAAPTVPETPAAPLTTPANTPSPLAKPSTPVATPTANTPGIRKISFNYHNAKAKKVLIKMEFEGWKAEEMERNATGTWSYTAVGNFPPGEYGYYLEVDGQKLSRDPANKRTKKIGPVILSAVVVKPS